MSDLANRVLTTPERPIINTGKLISLCEKYNSVVSETAKANLYDKIISELIVILKYYKRRCTIDNVNDFEVKIANTTIYVTDLAEIHRYINSVDVTLFDAVTAEVFKDE